MLCPYCHRQNRDIAKVCGYCGKHLPQAPLPSIQATAPVAPPPPAAARRFPSAALLAGCAILFVMGLLGSGGGIWYFLDRNGFFAAPTTIARTIVTATAAATPTPSATPTVVETATPAATLRPPTLAPIPTTTVPPIAGPKRFDPVGTTQSSVNVTDVHSGAQYLFFASPGAISGRVLSAAWSPDGNRVLLSYNWNSAEYDFGHVVRSVDENGANAIEIVRTGPSREGIMAAHAYRDAIWSPDGKRVAVRYQYGGDFGIWLFNSNGTGKQRLATSHIGDWPRFWSVDGKWVIGVSSSDNLLYAEEIDGDRRVPFAEIKGIKMYDEREYPWRVIQDPACNVAGDWFYTGGAFWDCQ